MSRLDPYRAAVKGAAKTFKDCGLTNWAAALTYFAVLSIFPALIALISVLGLIGSSAIDPLLEQLSTAAPGPTQELITQALEGLQNSSGGAGVTFVVGVILAIWAASGYVAGFMDASNAIHETEETRTLKEKLPTRVAVTVLELVLVGVCAIVLAMSGGIAREAGDIFGLSETAVDVWQVLKWPLLLVALSAALAVLYWAAPDVRRPGFKIFTAGSVTAVILCLLASGVFGFYVSNFGAYNKTYGSLGGAVVFLVWLWIANIAVLFGAAINSKLEDQR